MAVVRFTRDFLHLALAVNSSTIEANWPAALAMMAPELRERVGAEAASRRLVETYRLAHEKTELSFEDIVLEDRTAKLLTVRATLSRRTMPLVEKAGPVSSDRLEVELVEEIVTPTVDRPDGLAVAEWRLVPLPAASRPTALDASGKEPPHAR